MDFKPGDVANEHVLGADGAWHPIAPTGPGASAATAAHPDTYGDRYKRRWKRTALVFAFLGLLTGLRPGMGVIDVGINVVFDALVFGSLVNLVVALFPSRNHK